MESASLSFGKEAALGHSVRCGGFRLVCWCFYRDVLLEKREKIKAAVLMIIIICVLALGKGIIQSQ